MRAFSQISIDQYLGIIKPNLTAREEWVLEAFEDKGEASAETIAEHLGVGINVISGRVTGLKNKQMIIPTRRGTNKFGRLVQYYRPARQEVLREHE